MKTINCSSEAVPLIAHPSSIDVAAAKDVNSREIHVSKLRTQ